MRTEQALYIAEQLREHQMEKVCLKVGRQTDGELDLGFSIAIMESLKRSKETLQELDIDTQEARGYSEENETQWITQYYYNLFQFQALRRLTVNSLRYFGSIQVTPLPLLQDLKLFTNSEFSVQELKKLRGELRVFPSLIFFSACLRGVERQTSAL